MGILKQGKVVPQGAPFGRVLWIVSSDILTRKDQTTLFRLRFGQCSLNLLYLHRIGRHPKRGLCEITCTLPHSVPGKLPHSVPGKLPHSVPGKLPHSVPGKLPHSVPGKLPHSVPGKLPHSVPGKLPHSVPGKLPHSVPGELPHSVPGEQHSNPKTSLVLLHA
uniref:Uncharacterized protein n=1 Tax=Eptatretus burgeri TaxID=7764 RepID=A0A8C4R429_EPTBU